MKNVIFRKSQIEDLKYINEIVSDAKKFMKTLNIDQWQNGYPNEDIIKNDISKNISYVALVDGEIAGTIVVSFNVEFGYDSIYDGSWVRDEQEEYGTIHRFAVNNKFRGMDISKFLIQEVQKICLGKNIDNLRADTHKGNIVMQKVLIKNAFKYCGKVNIVCDGDTLRYAYQKILV